MAKKKRSNLKLLLSGVAAVLGVIAFIMLFVPAIAVKDSDTVYKGTQVVFGYSEKFLGSDIVIFKFSFMNLLPYLLVLAGIVFSVLSALGKLGGLSGILAAACFVVGGVLFFCTVAFCVLGDGFNDLMGIGAALAGKESSKDFLSLGAGSIVAGILSILAGVSAIAPMFLKK